MRACVAYACVCVFVCRQPNIVAFASSVWNHMRHTWSKIVRPPRVISYNKSIFREIFIESTIFFSLSLSLSPSLSSLSIFLSSFDTIVIVNLRVSRVRNTSFSRTMAAKPFAGREISRHDVTRIGVQLTVFKFSAPKEAGRPIDVTMIVISGRWHNGSWHRRRRSDQLVNVTATLRRHHP